MTRLWRWLADRLVPPTSLLYEPTCRYDGSSDKFRRFLLETGALT